MPPSSPYRTRCAGSAKAAVSTARAASICALLCGTETTHREPAYHRRTARRASSTSPVVPISSTCLPMRPEGVRSG